MLAIFTFNLDSRVSGRKVGKAFVVFELRSKYSGESNGASRSGMKKNKQNIYIRNLWFPLCVRVFDELFVLE